MIQYYLFIYLDIFIKGILFMLFGMKSWSIYTCNKDFFEKKYKHVATFSDIFKKDTIQKQKISVCDDDDNLEGMGFMKNALTFSMNTTDYWTKRWICYFLNFGLEPFCCDDPKQSCEQNTQMFSENMPFNTDILLKSVTSLIKIFVYAGLNLLYMGPIGMGVITMAGYNGSLNSKTEFKNMLTKMKNDVLEKAPYIPFFTEMLKLGMYFFGNMGIFFSKWIFFFMSWGGLSAFNYMRLLMFMLSGDNCGCNIFSKWKNQSNKLILNRIILPILIWGSLMFSFFIISQVLLLQGYSSPELGEPYAFKDVLVYYFMVNDINTLKFYNTDETNMKKFYNGGSGNFKDNLENLKKNINTTNTYYNDGFENILPKVHACLKVDLSKKNNLTELTKSFKNNQSTLNEILENAYGEGLSSSYAKIKSFRDYAINYARQEKKEPIAYNWFKGYNLFNETQINPDLIDYCFEFHKLLNQYKSLKAGESEKKKDLQKKGTDIHKKIIDTISKTKSKTNYYYNLKKILKSSGTTLKYDVVKFKSKSENGSIGMLLIKIYEMIAQIMYTPIAVAISLMESGALEMPQRFISWAFSEKTLNNITWFFMLPITGPLYVFKEFMSIFR